MLALTLLSLLLCAQDAAKKPGELPLTIPEGWEAKKQEGGRVLGPKNVPDGKVYTIVVPELAARSGSLKALLVAGKAMLAEAGKFTPSIEPAAAKNDAAWEYEVVIGTLEQDGAKLMAQVLAMRKGAEEGLLLLISDSVETMEKYAAAFTAMIQSLGASKPAARDEETYDLWKVPALEGWTKKVEEKYLLLTRSDGGDFCRITLWKSRAPDPIAVEQEFSKEWKDVIEHRYKTGAVTKLKPRRLKSGVVAQGTVAELSDRNGTPYHGALYVVAPYGKVVSIDVLSNTAASFARYEKAISEVLDSLRVEVGRIAGQAPVKPEDILGKWATSRSGNFDPFLMALHHGYDCRQYDFRKDRTYTFHLEGWGGSYRSDEYFIVDENGTYTVEGNTLTLTPRGGTTVLKNRKGEIQKNVDPRLETTTYLWQFHFFAGIQENNLVLTPPGETARDGGFAANALFNRSYLLSGKYNPEWTKFGK